MAVRLLAATKLICLCVLAWAACAKVVFVAELTTPGSTVPWTLLRNSNWTKAGRGQLSDAGRRAQYVAGLDLRSRYPELLNGSLPQGSVDYVHFQEPNTINSGHLRLAGLFDGQLKSADLPFPNEDPRLAPGSAKLTLNFSQVGFNSSLPKGFLPPLIAGTNNYQDFSLDKARCLVARSYEVRGLQKFNAQLAAAGATQLLRRVIEEAAELYEMDVDPRFEGKADLETCRALAEFALAEHLNDPAAQFASPASRLFVSLRNCFAAYQASLFADPLYLQAYVTPFLRALRAQLLAAAEDVQGKKRYLLFSDSQETVFAVLLQAGLVSADCIVRDLQLEQDTFGCLKNFQQASALAFELVRRDPGRGFAVQVRLDGALQNFCGLAESDPDAQACPLEAFLQRLDALTIPDLQAWCRQTPFGPDHGGSLDLWRVLALAASVLALLVAMLGWMLYRHLTAKVQTADVTESFNKTMGATITMDEKIPA